MLVEGSTRLSGQDISRMAAEMGGSLTSGSDDDNVTVGGQVLSESGAAFVALLGDVVLHPKFGEADVDRLAANMIRDNARSAIDPSEIGANRFRVLMFGKHPYARSMAPDSMLQRYDARTVRAFYDRNYGASRAHLYVSGVYDAGEMERAIRLAFSRWRRGPAPTINPPVVVARRQLELLDRPGSVQSTIRMGLPVADPSSPDWLRVNVTDAVLGGSFASRITSNIREDKGYTYSPFSFVASWPKVAVWAEVADVTTDVTGASLKEIFGEIDRLRNEAPSVQEVTGIKNGLVGQFMIQNSSRYGVISQLQFVDQYGLGDRYLATYVDNVMAVSPLQVQQMAKKYFDPAKMTITVVGDKKAVEPQIAPFKAGTP
jgi:predicted Zn-dependent peptidase